MKPSILILGHGRHGKDYFCELLCRKLPELTFTSSSWAVAEMIYKTYPFSVFYNNIEECYADRINQREKWYAFISEFNKGDRSRLAKQILSQSNIYVGMRSDLEYQASKSLFNHIFYVDASERVKTSDSTMKIGYNKREMIWIDNNGSKEDLFHEAQIASEIIKGRAFINGRTNSQ